MLACIFSCAVIGLEDVEVDYSSGMGGVIIVGLPDAAVQESRERVIVNLAPASVRKEGPSCDLPIAIASTPPQVVRRPATRQHSNLRHIPGVALQSPS